MGLNTDDYKTRSAQEKEAVQRQSALELGRFSAMHDFRMFKSTGSTSRPNTWRTAGR